MVGDRGEMMEGAGCLVVSLLDEWFCSWLECGYEWYTREIIILSKVKEIIKTILYKNLTPSLRLSKLPLTYSSTTYH